MCDSVDRVADPIPVEFRARVRLAPFREGDVFVADEVLHREGVALFQTADELGQRLVLSLGERRVAAAVVDDLDADRLLDAC